MSHSFGVKIDLNSELSRVFENRIPCSTLTFSYREISFVISITLRYPLPCHPLLVFSQTVALRSIAEAPGSLSLALPRDAVVALVGTPDAIGVAPPVNQPEVPLEVTRHTPCIVPGIPERTLVVPSSSQQILDPLVRQGPADTEQRSFRCVRLFLPTYLLQFVRLLERLRRLSPLVRDRIYPPGGRRGYSDPSRDRVLSRPDQPIDRSIMKTLGPDSCRLRRSSFS